MKISKEQFNDLKKKAVNCLVTRTCTKYRLDDGRVLVNHLDVSFEVR